MVKKARSRRSAKNQPVKMREPAPLEPSSSGRSRQRVASDIFKEWTQSAVAIMGGIHDYNPDELVIDKGIGVRIYQDMLRDPYVKAALGIKKLSVARAPHRILPASRSPEHQEQARFIEWTLENMETSIDTFLWGIMNAVDVGYSISEKNFKVIDNDEWRGKIGLKSVKSKDPYVYTFRIDSFGNVVSIIQRIASYYLDQGRDPSSVDPLNAFGQQEFDPGKFVITSFQPLYSNPYGSSDLRAAYRAFFIKDWAWKFRAIFIEKWGMPPVIGRFPNGTSPERRQQLEDVLDSIQNDTVITMPEDLSAEVLNLASAGRTTEFERAIADLNKEILIGIMGSFLSVEEGKRTGARAQGEVHFSVSKLFVEHLACVVQESINKSVIRPVIDLNYRTDRYPKYHIDISRVEEQLKDIDVDKAFKEMGVPLDKSYFYDKYNRPSPPESEIDRQIGRDPMEPGVQPDVQPDIQPDGQPDGFEQMRAAALPKDPQKIGKLRETYQWILKMREASGRPKSAIGPEQAGFEMAGAERAFRRKSGRWMTSAEAWLELKKVIRG